MTAWFRSTWVDAANVIKSAVRNGFRDFVPLYCTVAELQAMTTSGIRAAWVRVAQETALFLYDSADTTTADDGGLTCIVSADGQRFFRAVADGRRVKIVSGTSYTILATDRNRLLVFTNSSAVAVTLPQATGAFAAGWQTDIVVRGTGTVTVTPTTSTLNGFSSLAFAQQQGGRIVSDGTDYIGMLGRPLVTGVPPTVQTFTSSGTWTKPAGLSAAFIHVVGGGGAGGGAPTATSVNTGVGAGGGGGEYAFKRVAAGSLGSTETVTIGAGGTGASGTTGGNGGNSSFGSHVSANGGTGGGNTNGASATVRTALGGAGGTGGTGGTVQMPGDAGEFAYATNAADMVSGRGGGARGPFGGGMSQAMRGNSTQNGATGSAYGGGGSGATSTGGGTGTGGNGAAGVVIVIEYY